MKLRLDWRNGYFHSIYVIPYVRVIKDTRTKVRNELVR